MPLTLLHSNVLELEALVSKMESSEKSGGISCDPSLLQKQKFLVMRARTGWSKDPKSREAFSLCLDMASSSSYRDTSLSGLRSHSYDLI